MRKYVLTLAIACLVLITSCSSSNGDGAGAAPSESAPPVATEEAITDNSAPSDAFANLPQLNGEATVMLRVNGESIVIQVDGVHAPVTAGNFVDLVQRGVYDNTVFHRVVREPEPFVVQGGDPQSRDPNANPATFGTGSFVDPQSGQARYIPLEIQPSNANEPLYSRTFPEAGVTAEPTLTHRRGAVAMARSQFADSASAQFYFTLADVNFLDGSYAVFGYVTEGMEVVDQIQQGDRIESAEIIAGAENLTVAAE
ncbi:MAG: peptidylprolyl isomerase [Leptolyngbya sp. DLM2.Bin15]|nr:MAG: peptidylprolyl isomerase [Leptolyngbya sp. DLM2.Bin15]